VRVRGSNAENVRFTSTILPPYLLKAKSIGEFQPWFYLEGISTGDFHEALAALLRPMPLGCPRPRYHGSKPIGGMSITVGNGAT